MYTWMIGCGKVRPPEGDPVTRVNRPLIYTHKSIVTSYIYIYECDAFLECKTQLSSSLLEL